MSSELNINDDVKTLISDIISKNEWEPVTDVKYYISTGATDGYASKNLNVDIIRKNETFRLFVKYALEIASQDTSVQDFYANEVYFYDVIYPTFKGFLEKKDVEDSFRHVPKCYGTYAKNVIALENLKEKGFVLFDRTKIMNYNHISLALKTIAKFHAVSFALKDQQRELYDKLNANFNQDYMGAPTKGMDSILVKMTSDMIVDGLSKLDPEADKRLLEKCDVDTLINSITGTYLNEYSVLTQGDCWCNNMMFLYEEEKKESPTDIVLIDWQTLRPASTVLDISYFFFSIADEEALSKFDLYLKVYYEELSRQITQLGSDPDKLYPFSVLKREWKMYCKYGFAMAFMLIKYMLVKEDEIRSYDEMDFNEVLNTNILDTFIKYDNEAEYIKRLRILGEFMVNNDYV